LGEVLEKFEEHFCITWIVKTSCFLLDDQALKFMLYWPAKVELKNEEKGAARKD